MANEILLSHLSHIKKIQIKPTDEIDPIKSALFYSNNKQYMNSNLFDSQFNESIANNALIKRTQR